MNSTKEIFEAIIALSRKNGARIATDEEVSILNGFLDKTIELPSPQITKLKKILAKFVPKVIPISPKDVAPTMDRYNFRVMEVSLYSDIVYCRQERYEFLLDWNYYAYIDLQQDEYDVAETIYNNIGIIENLLVKPINDYLENLKTNAKRNKETAIKGKVPANILAGLSVLRDKWEIIIYDYLIAHFAKRKESAKQFLQEIKDIPAKELSKAHKSVLAHYIEQFIIAKTDNGYHTTSVEFTTKLSKEHARNEADSFLFKMCYKIGGLEIKGDVTIEELTQSEKLFTNSLRLKGEYFQFDMFNQIVINTSVNNNPYYQYPCVFENIIIKEDKYKRLSEAELKTKLNALV
jgi:hypothetical protein